MNPYLSSNIQHVMEIWKKLHYLRRCNVVATLITWWGGGDKRLHKQREPPANLYR